MARALLPLLVLVALAAGCDGTYFSAKVDAPEICASGMRLMFPPAAYASETHRPLTAENLGIDLLEDEGAEVRVEVIGVAMQPTGGVDDLGFIEALRVRAAPVDHAGELAPIELIAMETPAHHADGALYVEPTDAVDVADHLRAGRVSFTVDIDGELPEVVWQTSFEVCVRATARYDAAL